MSEGVPLIGRTATSGARAPMGKAPPLAVKQVEGLRWGWERSTAYAVGDMRRLWGVDHVDRLQPGVLDALK